jgi:hypothetical protein
VPGHGDAILRLRPHHPPHAHGRSAPGTPRPPRFFPRGFEPSRGN